MQNSAKDPLLIFARFLLMFFIVALGIAGAALLAALPVMLFKQADLLAQLAEKGAQAGPELITAASFVLVGTSGLIALGIYFLMLLRRIVNSVGKGDPFVPENAQRLSRMGWVGIILQVAGVPVGYAVMWISNIAADAGENIHGGSEFGFSGGGILLVLTLFILSRVFRTGTEMREDLEGTI